MIDHSHDYDNWDPPELGADEITTLHRRGRTKKEEPVATDDELENELLTATTQKALPRPYLTREETNARLETLGFEFNLNWTLKDTPEGRLKFSALLDLIGGAIAEYMDLRDDIREEDPPGDVNNELQEFAEGYLVG